MQFSSRNILDLDIQVHVRMSDFALFLGASSLLCASLAYKRHTRSRNGVRRSNPADGERRRHARSDAEPFRPFIIGARRPQRAKAPLVRVSPCPWTGVAGASGSGKTTVCRRIVDALEDKGRRVAVIASDAYYKPLGGSDPATHNFDEPNAIDFELLAKHVELLKVRAVLCRVSATALTRTTRGCGGGGGDGGHAALFRRVRRLRCPTTIS